jgi:hypothetical protein
VDVAVEEPVEAPDVDPLADPEPDRDEDPLAEPPLDPAVDPAPVVALDPPDPLPVEPAEDSPGVDDAPEAPELEGAVVSAPPQLVSPNATTTSPRAK